MVKHTIRNIIIDNLDKDIPKSRCVVALTTVCQSGEAQAVS